MAGSESGGVPNIAGAEGVSGSPPLRAISAQSTRLRAGGFSAWAGAGLSAGFVVSSAIADVQSEILTARSSLSSLGNAIIGHLAGLRGESG